MPFAKKEIYSRDTTVLTDLLWFKMAKVQGRGTALLLLVNPPILYHIKIMAPRTPVIIWKEDTSLLAMFNPLYNSMIQKLFEKSLCNQSSNYRQFPLQMEAIVYLPQNRHFS